MTYHTEITQDIKSRPTRSRVNVHRPQMGGRPPSRGFNALTEAVHRLYPDPTDRAEELAGFTRMFWFLAKTQSFDAADKAMRDMSWLYRAVAQARRRAKAC